LSGRYELNFTANQGRKRIEALGCKQLGIFRRKEYYLYQIRLLTSRQAERDLLAVAVQERRGNG
jgi:hypothetical protein